MALRITRAYRPVLSLALVNLGLVACGSGPPTAPSPLAASMSGAPVGPASGSSPLSGTASAAGAGADSIKITQGTLALQSLRPGTVTLKGSRGFRFEGYVQSGNEPSNVCGPFNPCAPGTTRPFAATWLGSDIPGTVRLQGDEFAAGTDASVYIDLTGIFVAPAYVADTASVTVPFTATGVLSPPGSPIVPIPLTGRGHVTFTLEWQTATGGWAIRYTSFDFGGGRP